MNTDQYVSNALKGLELLTGTRYVPDSSSASIASSIVWGQSNTLFLQIIVVIILIYVLFGDSAQRRFMGVRDDAQSAPVQYMRADAPAVPIAPQQRMKPARPMIGAYSDYQALMPDWSW